MVPNLMGREDREAYEILNRKGLYMKKIYKFHPRLPENHIVSQVPQAGLMVKKNRRIKVYISKGPKIEIIPDLEPDMFSEHFCSIVEAKNTLRRANLNIGWITHTHSSRIPQGYIIAQSPPPGSQIKRGEKINLLLSEGKSPALFYMPNFLGKDIEAVAKLVERMGLKVTKITEQVESHLKSGLVIKQEPPSNSPVKEGSPVSLTISTLKKRKEESSHYEILDYTLPQGLLPKVLKIVVRDERGVRQVYEEEKPPRSRIILPLWLLGEAKVEIYLDGKLTERKTFE
jgi:serine/threonine-protein kinase